MAVEKSRRSNRGLVVTGCVMAIIIGSFATIGGIISLIAVAAVAGLARAAPGGLPAIFYIIMYAVILFYVLVALVNFVAGIKERRLQAADEK